MPERHAVCSSPSLFCSSGNGGSHPQRKRSDCVKSGINFRPKLQFSSGMDSHLLKRGSLNSIVMVVEVDVSWPSAIVRHKVFITLWSLVLDISCQHALKAHANALDILYR
jgi:hypothetical protein